MTNRSPRVWHTAAVSVRGAMHVRDGLPIEDHAIATHLPDRAVVVAVADGHGAERHFRSDRGARFACEVFVEFVHESIAGYDVGPAAIDRLERTAAEQVLVRWRRRVTEDLHLDPIATDHVDEPDTTLRPYGSTLLGFVLTDHHLWWFQLGDGHLVEIDDAAGATLLCAPHALAIGDATPSLCSVGPERFVLTGSRRLADGTAPRLVAALTDGVSNSFETIDGMLQFFDDAVPLVRSDGAAAVAEYLPTWLAQMTEAGSGDDVTVAWAVRTDSFSEGPDA